MTFADLTASVEKIPKGLDQIEKIGKTLASTYVKNRMNDMVNSFFKI